MNADHEYKEAVGYAAHGNRGHYAGEKVHLIGAWFDHNGVTQSAQPVCGVTQGQWAARIASDKTVQDITCKKCIKELARRAAYQAEVK